MIGNKAGNSIIYTAPWMLTSFEGLFYLQTWEKKTMENRYQELMFKSELAEQTARNCETNWGWQYWQGVADKLKEEAYALPLEELAQ